MGITAFFYAAEGNVDEVEAALREVWPDEIGPLSTEVRASGSAVESIYRNGDGVQLVLWQDGKFTGFAESELELHDEEALCRLSARTGTVLSASIGDQGGYYLIEVYRLGRLLRSLSNLDAPKGDPIAEEAGVDVCDFSDSDVRTIWEAFGLTDFYEGIAPFRIFL